MCLRTRNVKERIAKKDIICYKSGSREATPEVSEYYNDSTSYFLNKPSRFVNFGITKDNKTYQIDEGYHTFNTVRGIKKHVNSDNECYIGVFIIPKGTKYIKGWYNNNRWTKNRVSNSITYVGPYKPKKWWQIFR